MRQIKSIRRITHFFYLSNGTYRQNLLEHIKLAMTVPICNPGTSKTNREGWWVQNQLTLFSKNLGQSKNKMKQYISRKNKSTLYTWKNIWQLTSNVHNQVNSNTAEEHWLIYTQLISSFPLSKIKSVSSKF